MTTNLYLLLNSGVFESGSPYTINHAASIGPGVYHQHGLLEETPPDHSDHPSNKTRPHSEPQETEYYDGT